MKLYKPSWIKFRNHSNGNSNKTIVYQLLEGQNFLFENISSSFIDEILSIESWKEINLNNIKAKFNSIPSQDVHNLIDELLEMGILVDHIFDDNEIKVSRKRVGDHRINLENSRDLTSESETKKKLPFFQSDPESDYASFIETDNIPMVVMFELTYNCNEMCVHCFNPGAARNSEEKSYRKSREEINIDDYASLIQEMDEVGVVKVILTGGDPFVKPGIWKILDLLGETNMVVDIYTNGLALLGRTERLANYWPLSIGLSIYSGDNHVHDSITRVPNSLKKSLKIAREFADLGVALYFKCPIMLHNSTSYFKVAEIAKDFGAIPQIDVSLTDAVDGDTTITENLQVKDDLLQLILRDPEIPLYVGKEVPDFGRQVKNKDEAFCGAGTQLMNITPEGDITPCNSFPTQFGNLKKDSFRDVIFNSTDLKKWQSTSINDYEECGTHEKCDYCSRCPGQSFIEHGSPLKASSANCSMAITRMNLAKLMRNGVDPLEGKTIKEKISNYQDNSLSVVKSNKQKSYRNTNINL
ncbi:MAG: radical SAM protein [Flavobacteriaceae bacterium]|nr:radical SAM protein [Flavobacteriaceae bacterium]